MAFADRAREPEPGLLARMAGELRHRGPDAEGFFAAPGIGLGHRRLEVIDPAGGTQPMTDASGRFTLVYNGEIYNFVELRGELEAEGVAFRTRSDTEVLLEGFARHGEAWLPRLVGMFAFAIWDARERTLWLARDRLGVKPLYVATLPDGSLVFGSELSALRASRLLEDRLDPDALARYLALGYVLGRASLQAGAERLPPATLLRWRAGEAPVTRAWWDLAAVWREGAARPLPPGEALEAFDAAFDTAVRQRLRSDVPLGVFLSSGLDSNSVVAAMRRHLPQVRSYSIGFEQPSYDESADARACAAHLGTEHADEVVDFQDPRLLLEIVARLDEPFADTSLIPTYALCRMARKHVTVALSGDGGDELLAGYVTHAADRIYAGLGRLPAGLVHALRRAVAALPDSRRKVNLLFRAKQFLAAHPRDACDAHAWWRMLADTEGLAALLGADPAALPDPFVPFRAAFGRAEGLGRLDRFLYVDYATWLADDILTKTDRASMSHGLEVRSPFLDHRLVALAARLAPRDKLRRLRGKQLLRRWARGRVAPSAVHGRKRGFNAPVSHWLVGPWREVARDALSPASLAAGGVLEPRAVERLWQEHEAGRRDHGLLLYTLLVLALWLRERSVG